MGNLDIKPTDNSQAVSRTGIHTLQSCGYLEGNKRWQNGDEQRPARGNAALQISNTQSIIYVTKCSNKKEQNKNKRKKPPGKNITLASFLDG